MASAATADLTSQTIQEFKEGKHNILVSTSIGEEGLDIGEVDFVVIYDMPKQSIKLVSPPSIYCVPRAAGRSRIVLTIPQLQRIGRTGRKRDGKVHVLMSEGREDMNWDTAQQTHREIQEEILHSRNLELFEDVEPLLPLGKFPTCVEQEMPVDPWDPADQKLKRRLPGSQHITGGRDKDQPPPAKKQRGNEIPAEAHQGFVSVADLVKQGKKAKGKKRARTKTPTPELSHNEDEDEDEAEHELLYGSTTAAASKGTGKRKAPAARATRKTAEPAAKAKVMGKAKAKEPKETKVEREHRLEKEERDRRAIDFFNACGPTRRRMTTPPLTPPSSPPPAAVSPPARRRTTTANTARLPPSPITDESLEREANAVGRRSKSPEMAPFDGLSQLNPDDLDWDLDSVEMNDVVETVRGPARSVRAAPPPLAHSRSALMMPPPPVPAARTSSPAQSSPFAIRPSAPGRYAIASVSPADAPARRAPAVVDSSPLVPQRQRHPPRPARSKTKKREESKLVRLFLSPSWVISGLWASADATRDAARPRCRSLWFFPIRRRVLGRGIRV